MSCQVQAVPARKRASVLLADDHAMVVEGLRRVLEPHYDVVGVVADGVALVKSVAELRPDAVVVDISMPLLNGIEAARQIRAANQQVTIVFLSMHPDAVYVSEALRAGGSAYVLKSSAGIEILTAIRIALQGESSSHPRSTEPHGKTSSSATRIRPVCHALCRRGGGKCYR